MYSSGGVTWPVGTETLRLADRLIDGGFEVVLPHLFGPLEKTNMVGNLARVFCMRREFRLFESNKSSPVVDWLKALCEDIRVSRGDSLSHSPTKTTIRRNQ
jgi:dienelactone hydrolase